jgi:hypothetical protein
MRQEVGGTSMENMKLIQSSLKLAMASAQKYASDAPIGGDRGAQALLTAFNELQKAISYLAQDLQGIDTKVSNLKKPT